MWDDVKAMTMGDWFGTLVVLFVGTIFMIGILRNEPDPSIRACESNTQTQHPCVIIKDHKK